MAQGGSTEIISMIKWIRTRRLSINNFLFGYSGDTVLCGMASLCRILHGTVALGHSEAIPHETIPHETSLCPQSYSSVQEHPTRDCPQRYNPLGFPAACQFRVRSTTRSVVPRRGGRIVRTWSRRAHLKTEDFLANKVTPSLEGSQSSRNRPTVGPWGDPCLP